MNRGLVARVSLLVLLALVVLPVMPAEAAKPLPPLDPTPYVEGNNAFGCDLYGVLCEKPGNLFFSPYSISMALGLARLGARGPTAAEMDATMYFPAESLGCGHSTMTSAVEPEFLDERVDGEWVKRPSFTLKVANTLWRQEGRPLELAFRREIQMFYRASAHPVDFRKSALVRKQINAWVERHTESKIKDLIPPGLPTPDTRLVLANAIYFKARWEDQFEVGATEAGTFTGRGGKPIPARFMRQTESRAYAALDEAQIVEIPYRGGKVALVIVLPRAKDGLAALEKKLDAKALAGWIGALKSRPVRLRLPRFEFTAPANLTEILKGLGMKAAFSPQAADFGRIDPEGPLWLGGVLHKAFVAVDENGTEAAAATAIMMLGSAAPGDDEPVVFDADHPFLFLIRHRPTGTVLFVGRMEAPTSR